MIKNTEKTSSEQSWKNSKNLGYGQVQDLNVSEPTLLEDWGFRPSAKNPDASVFHFRVKGKMFAVTANSIDDALITTKDGLVTFNNKKVIITNGKIEEALAVLA